MSSIQLIKEKSEKSEKINDGIKARIKELIRMKRKGSEYIFNDDYIDFVEGIDEKILKLRRSLENKYSKDLKYKHNKYIKTCFKQIDGYLIDDFIKEKNYSFEAFKLVLAEISTSFIDNTLVLWTSVKPISLVDWLEKFKSCSKVRQNKWVPKLKDKNTIYNETVLIHTKLNDNDIYWYIDSQYNNNHLFIIDDYTVKVLNKEEYLVLDNLDKIILSIFRSSEYIMANG